MGSSGGESSGGSSDERKPAKARRVGERRKRARKVFDPSENETPSKRRRGRPVNGQQQQQYKNSNSGSAKTERQSSSRKDVGPICTVCRRSKSATREDEKLIGCRDCSNKAHPSCLRGDGLLRPRPDNTWQCPPCKTCVVCIETADAAPLTVCRACSDAYHSACHAPRIDTTAANVSDWECRNCSDSSAAVVDGDPSVPDARDWSVEQVHDYFRQYFPEHAHAFRDSRVDGRSLMVMRRHDAVRNLGLALGPAVKIYRHVVKLQSRKDDVEMCWF